MMIISVLPQSLQKKKADIAVGSKFLEVLGHAVPAPVLVPKPGAVANISINWDTVSKYNHDFQLKKFMPRVKGCALQNIEAKRCYTAYYLGAVPASRTRTIGLRLTREAVVEHCLKWTWQWHLKLVPGASCPYKL